jgi:hypothetical protein
MHVPVDETPFHDLNSLRLKACLHNEIFILKENFVNDLSGLHHQSFYPKLPFGGILKDKQNG